LSKEVMAKKIETPAPAPAPSSPPAHSSSPKLAQKENIYQAEYFGSGTFRIVKPKRQERKRRQSALKGTTAGSRK
jgi:hypothetical protein